MVETQRPDRGSAMRESWERGQAKYTSARYYTPGRMTTQYRTTQQGRPVPMELLAVVHNDVPPADLGLQRVDLIVNSGPYDRTAQHANGHLVNAYDEQTGITDHTALYTDADMARIHEAADVPAEVGDFSGGGPPGAQIYSIRASVRQNERGELVIDTSAPMQPGSGASRYSLHDVQEGMNRAAQRDYALQASQAAQYGSGLTPQQGMEKPSSPLPAVSPVPTPSGQLPPRDPRQPGYPDERLRPGEGRYDPIDPYDLGARIPDTTPRGQLPPRGPQDRGVSSQAGLAAARGPQHVVNGAPKPGEPGSRFNPVVRERPRTPQIQNPDLIQSRDVPRSEKVADKAVEKEQRRAHRKEEMRKDGKMLTEGVKGAVGGAKIGAKAGSMVPGVGTAIGAVAGAGAGMSARQSAAMIKEGDARRAFQAGSVGGGVAGGAVAAKLAHDQKTRKEQQGAASPPSTPEKRSDPPKTPVSRRIAESKVGQAVQTPEFRAGAKRVGTESAKDALERAAAAKSRGLGAKGVAASAAQGAAVGLVRGVRSELANRDRTASPVQPSPSTGQPRSGGMADRLRTAADEGAQRAAANGVNPPSAAPPARPQSPGRQAPVEDGPQLG